MHKQPIYKELVNLVDESAVSVDLAHNESLMPILDQIGDARLVLMGEASHGTEEFYQARIALSKLLVEQKGFHAIAIEGDWPSAYQINRYIQGRMEKDKAREALAAFKRFPAWMWCNKPVLHFIHWLRKHNDNLPKSAVKVGFYGLDLYSLHDSMQDIINYLKEHQPDAAAKAIARYNCFDHVAIDPQMYGYLVNQLVKNACIKEVTEQFLEMQHQAFAQLNNKSKLNSESLYYATQNARLVKNAEEYYRAMFEPRAVSWNIRDQHMVQTLTNLMTHIETTLKSPAKIIVWAHNSHVGDARATEMSDRGEINVGQLVREQYDTVSYLLGFSTYSGTVRAASDWDCDSEIKKVNTALEGSYEALFHDAVKKKFFLDLRHESHLMRLLKEPELQRAIGVIYLPESERMSHYYFSRLPYQFDGIIHIDDTHAVVPLEKGDNGIAQELPETYPSGM